MAINAYRIDRLHLTIGRQKIFSGLNISIAAGRVTAIIGPSGCGKSSFLSCLNLLIEHCKDHRIEGTITCLGQKLHHLSGASKREYRRRVGTLFQQPVPFPTTIRKNIEIPLDQHYQLSRAEKNQKIQQALADVGLWDEICERLDSPAESLSGGQKQRLCLARALVLDPEIMLMDEPCSALDPLSTAKVDHLIVGFKEQLTTVIVTHNIQQARRIADDVIVFWYHPENGGYLIETGSNQEVFENTQHEFAKSYLAGAIG